MNHSLSIYHLCTWARFLKTFQWAERSLYMFPMHSVSKAVPREGDKILGDYVWGSKFLELCFSYRSHRFVKIFQGGKR